MNQEIIAKVMSVGNARVRLLLHLLTKGYSLEHIVSLKVADLGELKDADVNILREYLNTLGTEGIQKGILLPSKADQNAPISRENARQAIVGACKKAQVKLVDLDLGLTWSATKARPVIPEVDSMDKLMEAVKKIQGEKTKTIKTA